MRGARADDLIFLLRPGTLIHWCQPGNEWPEDFTREQLDPLAQGSCRFCGEPLPMADEPTTKEEVCPAHVASSAAAR